MDIMISIYLSLFQVINVFVTSLITNSLFDTFEELYEKGGVLDFLGTVIPSSGIFFTDYVMLQGTTVSHGGCIIKNPPNTI